MAEWYVRVAAWNGKVGDGLASLGGENRGIGAEQVRLVDCDVECLE